MIEGRGRAHTRIFEGKWEKEWKIGTLLRLITLVIGVIFSSSEFDLIALPAKKVKLLQQSSLFYRQVGTPHAEGKLSRGFCHPSGNCGESHYLFVYERGAAPDLDVRSHHL